MYVRLQQHTPHSQHLIYRKTSILRLLHSLVGSAVCVLRGLMALWLQLQCLARVHLPPNPCP